MNTSSDNLKEIRLFNNNRRVIAHITSSSWKQIPHVSIIYEPDITDFYYEYEKLYKKKLNDYPNRHKLTFNTLMIKAITEGLIAAPELNSHLKYNQLTNDGRLIIRKDINISFPWLLSNGQMITPVIPNAGTKSLDNLIDYISNLEKRIENTDVELMLYKTAAADTVNELKHLNFLVLKRLLSARTIKTGLKNICGSNKKKPEKDILTEKDILNGTVLISNIGSLYKGQRGCISLLEIIPPQIFVIHFDKLSNRSSHAIHYKLIPVLNWLL